MTYMKSIVSVLAGYLVFAISAVLLFQLSGIDPHAQPHLSFMFSSIIYGCAFSTLGGYITASIARSKGTAHAAALAVLLTALAGLSLIAAKGSHWTEIATIFPMSPCAILGGYLRKLRAQK